MNQQKNPAARDSARQRGRNREEARQATKAGVRNYNYEAVRRLSCRQHSNNSLFAIDHSNFVPNVYSPAKDFPEMISLFPPARLSTRRYLYQFDLGIAPAIISSLGQNGRICTAFDVMQELAKVCEDAARIGGGILLKWRGRFSVRNKARFDLVTEADLAAQEAIRKHLLHTYPDHGFLGEEVTTQNGNRQALSTHRFCWIVDPLDGTTNYVHGLKNYCTSVALHHEDQIVVAAVFDPDANECYTAMRGRGAFLNHRRVQTSPISVLDESLVAASFPPGARRDSADVRTFLQVLDRCQSVRRLGSAALNLCYVAAGRLDAYWAMNLEAWDMAAGSLLVEEAGGVISAPDSGPVQLDRPRLVASATRQLHDELLDVLGHVLKA